MFTIYNYFPLPWVKNVVCNVFNMHVTTNSGILDSYIDSNFITIGKNTILGEGSMVLSFVIFGKYILVKSVKIGDNVTIGNFSIVAPGTIIENDTIDLSIENLHEILLKSSQQGLQVQLYPGTF
ncbi:MAG: hypothetical protein P8Y70_18530 [Candidatus Lokiarchaeota archaeon]